MHYILGIDRRSLILFRQIIALLYIYTGVILRFQFFDFYSIENGPFTNHVMEVIQNRPLLTYILTSDFELKIFLIISLIVGILLFMGIFPSLMSFTAMLLYALLSRRFFPYFYGVDEIIVSVLFILGFVFLINIEKKDKTITLTENPFLFVLLVQVVIIYWFNGINKTDISWWKGEAVSMASFNALFNKPLALLFIDFDILNKFLSYLTLAFEWVFPLLIFLSIQKNKLRLFASIGIILFHWGINFFADVTLYKYTGIAFAVLLLPTSFWDRYPFFNKLVSRFEIKASGKIRWVQKNAKYFAYFLAFFLFFKAVNASLFKQNMRYQFIQNKSVVNIMERITSSSYSPFRQYWFMFAPSPPKESGYIAFEYIGNKKRENVNIYGNKMPVKDFPYYHPFHLCTVIQFNSIVKGGMPQENQFVLFSLFEYHIKIDQMQHSNRKQEDYELVIYQQTYNDFMKTKSYKFSRKVLASYQ